MSDGIFFQFAGLAFIESPNTAYTRRWGCQALSRFDWTMEIAARKLDQIDSVIALHELRIPPNNKLESLSGDRKGQYSIRINDQYRICFVWTESGPDQVEIVDYH